MRLSARLLSLLVVLSLALVACDAIVPGGSPSPTPGPSQGPVTTPDAAVAAVVATDPRLTGIGPLDPDMIGQSSWYEAVPASGVGAFVVTIRIGWGDCPAGCISRHVLTYVVQPDGSVNLQAEEGERIPADAWPAPGGDGRSGIVLTAVAGPVCPVEMDPPDPACAPKAVSGAVVRILDAAGDEIGRAQLDARGFAFLDLPGGDYVLEAQPVEGLLGTPEALRVTVVDGAGTPVELEYDTGIR